MSDKVFTTISVSNYCQLCGTTDGMMTPLRDEYATDEVKYVCGDCLHEINKHLNKLRNLSFSWWHLMIRKFITQRKGEK